MDIRTTEQPMQPSRAAVRLSWVIALLAVVAAGVGLFWQGGDGPFFFSTHRGQTVEISGRGLYRHDPTFAGAGARGTDAVTLVLGVPLLLATTQLYRHGSLRSGLLLMVALSWVLYVYASTALGTVAYNDLFLVYVVLFSASLFALMVVFRTSRCTTCGPASRTPRLGAALPPCCSPAAR